MLNVRLNVRLTKNPSTRLAGQLAGLRPLLQAVQNEFHTRRNPELVEYLEQVIADEPLVRANISRLQGLYDRFPPPARSLMTSARGWLLSNIRYSRRTFSYLA